MNKSIRIKLDEPVRKEVKFTHRCPVCQALMLKMDKYCSSCGAKFEEDIVRIVKGWDE